ncbi:MAG: YgiT-type zinc finger protein [Candidatus Syntropharchaeia archaeon]
MEKKMAYLDVSVSICPHCGEGYVDSGWYTIELESDVECGKCGREWNAKEFLTDRVLLEFDLDEKGKILDVRIKS